MDNHHLCSILLNLQYRLSDNDRELLYSYFKNDVSRRVGDDQTLSETLMLIQAFFDQDRINENDFNLLIDAFEQIRCFDAVALLEEHQHGMLESGLDQSAQSLALIMPSHIQEFLYNYEDEHPDVFDKLFENEVDYRIDSNHNIIEENNVTTDENTQKRSSLQKPCFCRRLFRKKCFVLLLILFLLMLGMLITVLVMEYVHINHLENHLRSNKSESNPIRTEELLTQIHSTTRETNDSSLKSNATIEYSNKTQVDCKEERSRILIKPGRKFGGHGGGDFDDSLLSMFTHSHYLSGFVSSDTKDVLSCQFIYRSVHDNQSRIESSIHGDNRQPIPRPKQHHLNPDERIEKVNVKLFTISLAHYDGVKIPMKIIREIQFITTKKRSIPPGVQLTGSDVESESFPKYTVGYVTGRAGLRIDQLQFFWYRTEQ